MRRSHARSVPQKCFRIVTACVVSPSIFTLFVPCRIVMVPRPMGNRNVSDSRSEALNLRRSGNDRALIVIDSIVRRSRRVAFEGGGRGHGTSRAGPAALRSDDSGSPSSKRLSSGAAASGSGRWSASNVARSALMRTFGRLCPVDRRLPHPTSVPRHIYCSACGIAFDNILLSDVMFFEASSTKTIRGRPA
jgi:hypothetical protein